MDRLISQFEVIRAIEKYVNNIFTKNMGDLINDIKAIPSAEPKTDALNKIRAEIDGLTYYWCEVNPRSVIDDVLNIIDKYKAESEPQERSE